MSEFLKSFNHEITDKRERLCTMFGKGRVSELDDDLANLLRANWRPL